MHVFRLQRNRLRGLILRGYLTMRYLLHETMRDEMKARQQYLFDVFKLYFLPGRPEGGFIPLLPVGKESIDVLFITGHVHQVMAYLEDYVKSVPEETIVITSCMGKLFTEFSKKKVIYVPDLNSRLCLLRDGAPYGFGFDISDAELDFYNSSGSTMERIMSAYDRLS